MEARPLLQVEGAEEAVPLAQLIRATKVREGNVADSMQFLGGGAVEFMEQISSLKTYKKRGFYTFLESSGIHGTNFQSSTKAKTFAKYSEYKTRF